MESKRKPYIREVSASWWKKNPNYRLYMLREGTAIFQVWVALLFLCYLAHPSDYFTITRFFLILKNPFVICMNIIALLAALLHTKTWFDLMPKAINGDAKQEELIKKTLWIAFAAASVLVPLFIF